MKLKYEKPVSTITRILALQFLIICISTIINFSIASINSYPKAGTYLFGSIIFINLGACILVLTMYIVLFIKEIIRMTLQYNINN